jgi:hypothetical protein
VSWQLTVLLVSLVVLAFVGWGAWHLRRNVTGAMRRLSDVQPEAIPALAVECRTTVRDRLRIDLDPADPRAAAARLDELVLEGRLRPLFRVPGYELRYAECVGAFLGEMIRRHASAEWHADPDTPKLVVHRPAGAVQTFPFMKAVRHHTHGRAGELERWVDELLS